MATTIGDNTVVAVINGTGSMLPSLVVSQVITFVAALVSVGLRFLARRLNGVKLGRDDWLVFMAMVVGIADFGVICWSFAHGEGKYIGEVTPARLRQTIIIILLVELFWATMLFLSRASALVLWYNIFPQPWVRRFCRFWRLLNFLFWIASVLITCLQCNPPWLFFYPLDAPPGACIGTKRPYTALGVISVVLDAVVIALPTALVLRVQLSRAMKLTVCALILTSSLTIIFTIVRIVVLRRSDLSGPAALNTTWVYAEVGYWTVAESYVAIVSACLPCLRPVLLRIVPRSWLPEEPPTTSRASPSVPAARSGMRWSGLRMSRMQRFGRGGSHGGSESEDASRAGSGADELDTSGTTKWAHTTVTDRVNAASAESGDGGGMTPSSTVYDRIAEPVVEAGTQGSDKQDPTMKMLPPEPTLDYWGRAPAGAVNRTTRTMGRSSPLGWLRQHQDRHQNHHQSHHQQDQQSGRVFHHREETGAASFDPSNSEIQAEHSIEVGASRNGQNVDDDSTGTGRLAGDQQYGWA